MDKLDELLMEDCEWCENGKLCKESILLKTALKQLISEAEIKARQNEIAISCLAGVGGLTPEQQVYFERRLHTLKQGKDKDE